MKTNELILKLEDEPTRWEAISTFRKLKDPNLINDFIPFFNSRLWITRWILAETAGNLQHPQIIPFLIPLLIDKDFHVRKKAYKAMLNFGKEAIPHLIKHFSNHNIELRKAISQLLIELGKDVIGTLAAEIPKHDWIIGNKIVETIWLIGGEEAELALIKTLKNEHVQKSAIIFLGEMKSKEVIPHLLDLFHLPPLQNLILNTFNQISPRESYTYIAESLCTDAADLAGKARRATLKIGRPMLGFLKKARKDCKECKKYTKALDEIMEIIKRKYN